MLPKELKKDLPFKTKMKNQQKQIAGVNKASKVPVIREEKDKKVKFSSMISVYITRILGCRSVQYFGSSSKREKRKTKGRFEGSNRKVQGAYKEAAAKAAATEQRYQEENLFESAERSVEINSRCFRFELSSSGFDFI